MQSLNNQSTTPLRASAIFIGLWDDILQYQNIQLNLKTDTNCQITYYESNDKVSIQSTTFNYTANSNYFNSINSSSRYVYFTVRNTSASNQTIFNFSVLYRYSPEFTANIGSNVDARITSPLNLDGSVFVGGNLALSGSVDANITNASLDVNVTNPVTSVDANITNTSLDVSDGDTHTKLDTIQTQLEKSNKGTSTLWSNSLTGVNGVSLIANLSNVNQSNLTIFGSVDGATNLVVQFSNDGTNFYDSQYSYVQSASGNWGFNITACPLYLRLKSTNSVTAYAFVNYS